MKKFFQIKNRQDFQNFRRIFEKFEDQRFTKIPDLDKNFPKCKYIHETSIKKKYA